MLRRILNAAIEISFKYEKIDPVLNDLIPGCENFKWREALILSAWSSYASADQKTLRNIVKTAVILEVVRELLDCPLIISSWYRPGPYNTEIGGAPNSKHKEGLAVDFKPTRMTCDEAREKLLPYLEELGIRMEDNPGSNWVHIDLGKVKNERFFKP